MTSGQKIAFSSLISIALFGAFAFLTRSGFIPEIETRFYAQAKIQQKEERLNLVSESVDLYIQNVLTRIENGDNAYLKSVAVSTYLSQDPAESDTVERRNQTEQLFYDFPALSGIRFIDKNGRNIHFSTYERTDVAKHVGLKKQYKNYTDIIEDEKELDVHLIFSETHRPDKKVYFDSDRNRFIIVIPVNWLENVYAGCFLFYFDVQALENQLIEETVLPFADSISLISDKDFNGGFVLGIPKGEKNVFSENIVSFWKNKSSVSLNESSTTVQPEKLLSMKDGRFWMILNSAEKRDFWTSGVYTSDIFELSKELIYLIYVALFISIFLIVFLIFSLKRDSMLVLQKKIKKLQYGIIKEYLNNQEKVEWKTVAKQLEVRNSEINQEIRKSLGKKNKYNSDEIDAILDKSWNEIIDVVTHYSGSAAVENDSAVVAGAPVTLDQIRDVMKELLQTTTVNVAHSANVDPSVNVAAASVSSLEKKIPRPEVEDIEEVEEVEELDDVEPVEEVEEVEEIEEVETLDEPEELEDVEEVAEVEEVEELDDVEPVEDVDELDDVELVEDVEELDEPEPAPSPAMAAPQSNYPVLDGNDIKDVSIFVNNDFATTDTVLLEELTIGSEIKLPTPFKTSDIIIYPHREDKVDKQEIAEIDSLEEIQEDSITDSSFNNQFSMIQFGLNVGELQELQEEKPAQAIVENDGVFSISQNLEYSKVQQNIEFKNLVDSVLHI